MSKEKENWIKKWWKWKWQRIYDLFFLQNSSKNFPSIGMRSPASQSRIPIEFRSSERTSFVERIPFFPRSLVYECPSDGHSSGQWPFKGQIYYEQRNSLSWTRRMNCEALFGDRTRTRRTNNSRKGKELEREKEKVTFLVLREKRIPRLINLYLVILVLLLHPYRTQHVALYSCPVTSGSLFRILFSYLSRLFLVTSDRINIVTNIALVYILILSLFYLLPVH